MQVAHSGCLGGAVSRYGDGNAEAGHEFPVGVEHGADPVFTGVGGRRGALEDFHGRCVQRQRGHPVLADSRPEAAGRELPDCQGVGAGAQGADDAVSHRIDVEQWQRSEHPVACLQVEGFGHRRTQPQEVLVGLGAELRQPGGSGGVHEGGEVRRCSVEAGAGLRVDRCPLPSRRQWEGAHRRGESVEVGEHGGRIQALEHLREQFRRIRGVHQGTGVPESRHAIHTSMYSVELFATMANR